MGGRVYGRTIPWLPALTTRRARVDTAVVITGYNTDVEYDGQVFHVQTEDRGRENPTIETLVYLGGAIVETRRTGYGDLDPAAADAEAAIMRLMERQHQAVVREIRNGRLDPEGPKPFGSTIVSNRSLDEVVLEYLARDAGLDALRIELDSREALLEGQPAVLGLRVVADSPGRPVAGALVTVKLISTHDRPREIARGETGEDGSCRIRIDVPVLPGAHGAIVCQAQSGNRNAELKRPIRKP